MLIRFLLFLIVVFYSNIIHSQTCCSGGVPITNNIGLPILNKGDTQFGVFYDYNRLNTLKEGSTTLKDNSRLRITNSVLLNFNYNFSNKLSVEGLFTWVNQKRLIRQLNSENLDETSGLGDAVILIRYKFYEKGNNEILFGIGGKVPIGATDKKNGLGVLLNADLQPGSDTFDFLFSSTYRKKFEIRKSLSLTGKLLYKLTGINNTYLGSQTFKFGNEFQVFLGITDQYFIFKQIVNTSLFFKYRNVENDMINRNTIESTGGNWFFIMPSLDIAISSIVNVKFKYEQALYGNVNGIQLSPTSRINAGVIIKLLKKNNRNNDKKWNFTI